MRIAVFTFGLAALISTGLAAQSPEKLTITPLPQSRARLDFGLEQAQKNLPQGPWKLVQPKPKHTLPMQATLPPELAPPIDCAMVKTHSHHPMPILKTIEPPANTHHHLKTMPVVPCPVR